MAQATKSPEAVKSSVVVKSQVVEQSQEVVANLSETLLNTFSEGLESAYAAQKKLEDQFLEALNNQESEKALFGKLSEDDCSCWKRNKRNSTINSVNLLNKMFQKYLVRQQVMQ